MHEIRIASFFRCKWSLNPIIPMITSIGCRIRAIFASMEPIPTVYSALIGWRAIYAICRSIILVRSLHSMIRISLSISTRCLMYLRL